MSLLRFARNNEDPAINQELPLLIRSSPNLSEDFTLTPFPHSGRNSVPALRRVAAQHAAHAEQGRIPAGDRVQDGMLAVRTR